MTRVTLPGAGNGEVQLRPARGDGPAGCVPAEGAASGSAHWLQHASGRVVFARWSTSVYRCWTTEDAYEGTPKWLATNGYTYLAPVASYAASPAGVVTQQDVHRAVVAAAAFEAEHPGCSHYDKMRAALASLDRAKPSDAGAGEAVRVPRNMDALCVDKTSLFVCQGGSDGDHCIVVRGFEAVVRWYCQHTLDWQCDTGSLAEARNLLTDCWEGEWNFGHNGTVTYHGSFEDGWVSVARITDTAALALPPSIEPAGWRDIASAPVWQPGLMVWVCGGQHDTPELVSADGAWWRQATLDGLKGAPTHWHPQFVPAPPAPEVP